MFFLRKFEHIIEIEHELKDNQGSMDHLKWAKTYGFSDRVIGHRWGMDEEEVFKLRKSNGIMPVYKMVDTCAAEFESETPSRQRPDPHRPRCGIRLCHRPPETVSTDFSISDKLYFEPLTHEDVMNIIDLEQPKGVVVQFGGQTAINLADKLERDGVKILGTIPG